MKFGFMAPRESDFADRHDPYPRIFEMCQVAEDLGFDFVTFTHHRFSPERPHLSSPFVLMSAIAAHTSRLELVTTVFVLPLYHPLDVAESVASLDQLSNGRMVLGVGTGYREYEAAAVGVPFNKRVSRMTESIDVLRRSWSDDAVDFHGSHFDVDGVCVVPKPARPGGPPIWIGALEEKAVARAGRVGDGWIAPYLQTVETLEGRARVYRAAAAEHGRPSTVCLERDVAVAADRDEARAAWMRRTVPLANYYRTHGAPLPDWPDVEQPTFEEAGPSRAIAGTPDDCIREIEHCRDVLGCEYLSLMNMGTGPSYGHAGSYEHERKALELFGRAVIPAFR